MRSLPSIRFDLFPGFVHSSPLDHQLPRVNPRRPSIDTSGHAHSPAAGFPRSAWIDPRSLAASTPAKDFCPQESVPLPGSYRGHRLITCLPGLGSSWTLTKTHLSLDAKPRLPAAFDQITLRCGAAALQF